MTVCAAALAEEGTVIVMVADKAVTYGGYYRPAMTGDINIHKILPIAGTQWQALVAGDATTAAEVTRLASALISKEPVIATTVDSMIDCLRAAYSSTLQKAIEEHVLAPMLLTKDLLVARPNTLQALPDAIAASALERVVNFRMGTQLLVCGFDAQAQGHLFSIGESSRVERHDMSGFGAIGIGAETAQSRLLWLAADSEDDAEVALYQVCDAKFHAEKIQGVGAYSDAWIMTANGTVLVPLRIMDLIMTVFLNSTALPFKPREGWGPIESMPKQWERTLKKYIASVLSQQREPATQSETDSCAK